MSEKLDSAQAWFKDKLRALEKELSIARYFFVFFALSVLVTHEKFKNLYFVRIGYLIIKDTINCRCYFKVKQ